MKQTITKLIGGYLNTVARVAPKTAGRHGFNVFCYPYRAPIKPFHKEFLDSADKFSFKYSNTLIQGYRWGQGPKKVLFLHGWQSHSFRWKNYIQALPKDEYTIYAIDAPGHGLSRGKFLTVTLYSAVIQQLITSLGGVEAVVSHSIGAFSAMHALYANPALPVGKLVVMASPGDAMSFIDFYRNALQLSEATTLLTLNHFETVIGKPVQYFTATRFAEKLTLPGLIIHDREDKEAPYEAGVAIHKAWKGSKLITTEGLAHNLKSPDVVAMVKNYLMDSEVPAESERKGKTAKESKLLQ
ncbi:alpha/beta fold hydrolase [Cesiribacter sp. SM1]|uniref:alpha/beta fold hydrolase n=1 Tax=Cesiribacter sp. SM1 TaxID=2861196 RepID=UPI001CD2392B|nr:alpha/beta hydrolase [Cesiribacter sp. SM1]